MKEINYVNVGETVACGHCKPNEIFELPEKYGVTCECKCHFPQPEEWESKLRYLGAYNYVDDDEQIDSIIRAEIRKAEERKCKEIVEYFQRMQERYPEFCLDLELFEGDILVNTTKYKRVALEALKKQMYMKDPQNCPYCQSEIGITQPWGLAPQGWINMKIIHNKEHK
jgi:hypothetical protein